jgi:putative ABC transport system ATP-binding protein
MLKLLNIAKTFETSFAPVINDLNLELQTGDFCIVIGSNGSGKSTLMRCISGEYAIDRGQIIFNNNDLTHADRSALIATVTQDVSKGTISEMTLLENMVLSKLRGANATLSLYKKYDREVAQQIAELDIGLEKYLNKPLSSLSGGQRQMIATLMAICSKPQVLLLDEHTSALDPKLQSFLMAYTAQTITNANITSLMITHRLDDAIKYGNRLIMLHQGRIVFDVSGAEKFSLNTTRLLSLFHKYEDLILTKEQGL